MTPDELDTAIRQELQFAARLAPDAGPVRRRVLLAAEALNSESRPQRGLRAWTVPMLAAAAVLVALVLTAAGQALRADRSPAPPVGVTPAPVDPSPTGSSASPSTTASPSRTASPSATVGAGGAAPRSSARHLKANPSQPAGTVPTDWFQGLNVAALPHTPGLCSQAGSSAAAAAPAPQPAAMPGEPTVLWLVPATCTGASGPQPRPVEVFRYTPSGPQLVQTLAYQAGDPRRIATTALSVSGDSVTLSESGYDTERDDRSLRYTQTFTWQSGQFVAGPQQDAVQPCADGQLLVSGAHDASQDGTAAGVLLTYTNNTDVPCVLTGYPAASVVDDAGQPLAQAASTPSGPLGGLSGGAPPRVVLLGSVTGSAVVEWSTVQQGATACYPMATVAITPPGMGVSSTFSDQPMVCDPQVHPVVYGGSGRQEAGR